MNYIKILEPRWSTKDVLIADYKVGDENLVTINHHDFPQLFYMTGRSIKSYPTQIVKSKQGRDVTMHIVPLEDLTTNIFVEEL